MLIYFRLLDNFKPTSFLHKEMLAVLAAVTEVIKAHEGKETSTEYFAALVSISIYLINTSNTILLIICIFR